MVEAMYQTTPPPSNRLPVVLILLLLYFEHGISIVVGVAHRRVEVALPRGGVVCMCVCVRGVIVVTDLTLCRYVAYKCFRLSPHPFAYGCACVIV